MLTKEELERLKKKYFPRIPWTENGPVRRMYRVRATGEETVLHALTELACRERFIDPDQHAVCGDERQTLEAFCAKAEDRSIGMVFGLTAAAHWCDISLGQPDPEGWQPLIVRSEEGENLVALAHGEGLLRFRRA